MITCTGARLRAFMAFALLAFFGATAPALALDTPGPDERLTWPRNHIAYDHGTGWNDAIHSNIRFDPAPGMAGNKYTTCFGQKVWHTQSVARLPNKDGRAYFAVAQSFLKGGYISVLQTAENGYDPATEVVKEMAGGRYIWQDIFGPGNPHGEANHPGKIEVVGGLMIVALQDWRTSMMTYCNGYLDILAGSEPGNDGVAFYDVRDPEHPKFLGRIRASEVGIAPSHVGDSGDVFPFTSRQVESVSLWRSPSDEWFLTFGGQGKVDGGALLKAGPNGIQPSSGLNYTKLGTEVYGTSGPYGMNFDSYELLRAQSPGGVKERNMFWLPRPDGVDKDSPFYGSCLDFAGNRTAFAPGCRAQGLFYTFNYDAGGQPVSPTGVYELMDLEGNGNHWETASVYVTRKGMPILYAMLNDNDDDPSGWLRQVVTTQNLQLPPVPHPDRVVTNCNDHGKGSLRSAIGYGGRVTFNLDSACDTITLTSGPLVFYLYDTEVDGSLAGGTRGITISGNAQSRVIEIVAGSDSATPNRVTLSNLTIASGKTTGAGEAGSGAGIRNAGFLTLKNATLRDNNASASGGGIANWGVLSVENSTLARNTAAVSGAGIVNYKTAVVRHSTIAQNDGGSGIRNLFLSAQPANAGLFLDNSIVVLNTPFDISGNVLTSGANIVRTFASGGVVTGDPLITSDPVLGILSDNGGPTLTMRPAAGSPAIDGAIGSAVATDQRGLPRPFGARADIGAYETQFLVTSPVDGQINVPFGSLTLTWGQIPPGTSAWICFAGPGTVGNGAGFCSPGMDFLGSSKSGSMVVPTTLQAGAQYTWQVNIKGTRGSPWIGSILSFTVGARPPLIVTTAADENNPAFGQGAGLSLREAIAFANPGETITFAPGLATQIIGVGTELVIDKDLIIDASALPETFRGGPRGGRIAISAFNASRVFNLVGSGNVVLNSLFIMGGNSGFGGAILSSGKSLTLKNSQLMDNTSPSSFGGAIYSYLGSSLNIVDSVFTGNSASEGGAIWYNGGDGGAFAMRGSTVSANIATGKGGGLFLAGGAPLIENSTLAGNRSNADGGGAIATVVGAALTLRHATIANNQGAGIDAGGGTIVLLDNSIVANNTNVAAAALDVKGDFTAFGANLVRAHAGTLLDGPAPLTADPLLQALLGANPQVMIPIPSSPAIDAGVKTGQTPEFDQLLHARVRHFIPDLGAVEENSALSADASLQGLRLNVGAITPAFGPAVTTYTVQVASTVTAIAVQLVQGSQWARSWVLPNPATNQEWIPVGWKEWSPELPLNAGSTVIQVQVAAEDWLNTTDYTINVVRGTTTPVDQTITFGPTPTVFGTLTTTIVATASSGLPVTFDTLTPTMCKVEGSTVFGTSSLSGVCIIQASQGGNAIFAPAPTVNLAFDAVGLGKMVVATARNPGRLGEPLVFTATVPVGEAGTVSFKDGASAIAGCGAAAVSAGRAQCTTSALALGTHAISAQFPGRSSNTLTQEIAKATSVTTLTSSLSPSPVGQGVTFTAAVAGQSPTGTVTFAMIYGDGPFLLCGDVVVDAGQATCTIATLPAGERVIHATYSGDAVNTESRSVLTQVVSAAVAPPPPGSAVVIEFYNSVLDNYFITAEATEATAIDNGAAGPGWARTGNTFKSGGAAAVCRFYGSQAPGPNSHFYTVDAAECAALKQLQASTPASQKRWNFESLDFLTTVPVNGACPGGTTPVYRAYNNGFARNVDSNHRITSSAAGLQQVIARGWIGEGIVMCAPL